MSAKPPILFKILLPPQGYSTFSPPPTSMELSSDNVKYIIGNAMEWVSFRVAQQINMIGFVPKDNYLSAIKEYTETDASIFTPAAATAAVTAPTAIKKDPTKFLPVFAEYAARGFADAAYYLSECFEKGIGVEQNYHTAKWLQNTAEILANHKQFAPDDIDDNCKKRDELFTNFQTIDSFRIQMGVQARKTSPELESAIDAIIESANAHYKLRQKMGTTGLPLVKGKNYLDLGWKFNKPTLEADFLHEIIRHAAEDFSEPFKFLCVYFQKGVVFEKNIPLAKKLGDASRRAEERQCQPVGWLINPNLLVYSDPATVTTAVVPPSTAAMAAETVSTAPSTAAATALVTFNPAATTTATAAGGLTTAARGTVEPVPPTTATAASRIFTPAAATAAIAAATTATAAGGLTTAARGTATIATDPDDWTFIDEPGDSNANAKSPRKKVL